MIRQRVRLRSSLPGRIVTDILVSLFGLALVFYGAMAVLAALKLSPATINSISRYRTVFHALSSIDAAAITGSDRIVVAIAGAAAFLAFAPLAWRAFPRPYLGRTVVTLPDGRGPGDTEIGPRALERAAELAAGPERRVRDARARYDTGTVDVRVALADGDAPMLDTLRDVRGRIRSSLAQQGLPAVPVDVTLIGDPPPPTPRRPHS